jgi:hypothetical protein
MVILDHQRHFPIPYCHPPLPHHNLQHPLTALDPHLSLTVLSRQLPLTVLSRQLPLTVLNRQFPLTVLDRQDQSIALDRQYPKWTLASAESNLQNSLQTAVMDITANLNLLVICPNLYIMCCHRHRLSAAILWEAQVVHLNAMTLPRLADLLDLLQMHCLLIPNPALKEFLIMEYL